MQGPDWQQPFILIFEWGMFILGWGIVVVLSFLAILVVAAFIRATIVVAKKKSKKTSSKKDEEEKLDALAERVAKNLRASGSLDDNPPKI